MDVLPLVLSEQDVKDLFYKGYLQDLRQNCTQLVLSYIKRYLATPGIDHEVDLILSREFEVEIFSSNMNKDVKLTGALKKLNAIREENITAEMSLEELKEYSRLFDDVDKVEAIAWHDPKQKESIEELITRLNADESLEHIGKKLSKHINLFVDKENRSSIGRNKVGTVFKTYVSNTVRFANIKVGINFLIDMKEKGINPLAWRHL